MNILAVALIGIVLLLPFARAFARRPLALIVALMFVIWAFTLFARTQGWM